MQVEQISLNPKYLFEIQHSHEARRYNSNFLKPYSVFSLLFKCSLLTVCFIEFVPCDFLCKIITVQQNLKMFHIL